MNGIRRFLENKYARLTDDDWLIVAGKLIRKEFKKRTLILNAGQIENHPEQSGQVVSFVEQGIVRYYLPKAGKEITFEITFANDFIARMTRSLRERRRITVSKQLQIQPCGRSHMQICRLFTVKRDRGI